MIVVFLCPLVLLLSLLDASIEAMYAFGEIMSDAYAKWREEMKAGW